MRQPGTTLRLMYGFNQDWGVAGGEAIFERADWMSADQGGHSGTDW